MNLVIIVWFIISKSRHNFYVKNFENWRILDIERSLYLLNLDYKSDLNRSLKNILKNDDFSEFNSNLGR